MLCGVVGNIAIDLARNIVSGVNLVLWGRSLSLMYVTR